MRHYTLTYTTQIIYGFFNYTGRHDIGEFMRISNSGDILEHSYYINPIDYIKLDHPLSDNEKIYFTIKYGLPFLPTDIINRAYELPPA